MPTEDLLARLGLGVPGELARPHVVMPESEAVELVREFWSLDAKARRLAAEKDDTFRIDTRSGDRYVLKVANPQAMPDDLAFESAVMRHVQQTQADVCVPALVRANGDLGLVPLHDAAGQSRLARVMTFLDGTPLDSTGSSAGERERVGEALAKLRHATSSFPHPAEMRPCCWDVAHLPALRPLLDGLENSEQGGLVREAFDRYIQVAAPHVRSLRHQVLHNDFSKSNILVDHRESEFVKGIIDFGDVVHTAIVVDVSTALLNQLPVDAGERQIDDVFEDGRDLLRGYLRYADLTAHELELLPHLVMGRVVARALITSYRAKLVPDNAEYILRNTEQGWGQLEWFLARTEREIRSSFL